MRKADTHKQALRAALQVARGNRRQATAAVTGLVMLGGCGGDADGQATPQQDAEVTSEDAEARAANDVEALVDALDEAAQDTLEGVAEDAQSEEADQSVTDEDALTADAANASDDVEREGPASDASGVEDTMGSGDVSTAPGPDDDASASDSGVEAESDSEEVACIDSCWQPNGVTCAEHMDCAVPEDIVGACSLSEEPCVYDFECIEEGEECVGAKPSVYPDIDPETGDITPYSSGVACFDGVCHEGSQISKAAQACCGFGGGEEELPFCEDLSAPLGGCTPWGPPAPPSHDGTTLAMRMKRWLS